MYSQKKRSKPRYRAWINVSDITYWIIDISISDTYRKANTRIANREYPVYSRALLIFGLELIPLEMEFILSISVMFYGLILISSVVDIIYE